MKFSSIVGSTLAVAALAFATSAFAQDMGAIVKERTGIMKSVSGAVKALDSSAKAGKVASDDAARAAKALASYKKYTSLFPVGSDSGKVKTRAKPGIWQDKARFEATAGKLVAALGDIEKAAKAGDAKAMGGAVKVAQETCNTCHKAFRGPRPE